MIGATVMIPEAPRCLERLEVFQWNRWNQQQHPEQPPPPNNFSLISRLTVQQLETRRTSPILWTSTTPPGRPCRLQSVSTRNAAGGCRAGPSCGCRCSTRTSSAGTPWWATASATSPAPPASTSWRSGHGNPPAHSQTQSSRYNACKKYKDNFSETLVEFLKTATWTKNLHLFVSFNTQ